MMEIYIRVQTLETGKCAWWNKKELESYLFDSQSLWAKSKFTGDDFLAGTAFKSFKELKREAREAKFMAEFDGWNDVKVTFWKLGCGGKPIQVKFTRDGKIKK